MPTVVRKPKSTASEADIQSQVRAWLASQPDIVIFRNAQAYVTFLDGHKARVGLGDGSADLIGSLTIMVGDRKCARAIGIELKRPGQKMSEDQRAWHTAMRLRGWVVGVVTCVDEAKSLIEQARLWTI